MVDLLHFVLVKCDKKRYTMALKRLDHRLRRRLAREIKRLAKLIHKLGVMVDPYKRKR